MSTSVRSSSATLCSLEAILFSQVLLIACKESSPLLHLQRQRSRSSARQSIALANTSGSTRCGSADPLSPRCRPSTKCGSPRKSTTSGVPRLFANAFEMIFVLYAITSGHETCFRIILKWNVINYASNQQSGLLFLSLADNESQGWAYKTSLQGPWHLQLHR